MKGAPKPGWATTGHRALAWSSAIIVICGSRYAIHRLHLSSVAERQIGREHDSAPHCHAPFQKLPHSGSSVHDSCQSGDFAATNDVQLQPAVESRSSAYKTDPLSVVFAAANTSWSGKQVSQVGVPIYVKYGMRWSPHILDQRMVGTYRL